MVFTGELRLGRLDNCRLELVRQPRRQEGARTDPDQSRSGGWFLLREELQHLAGTRQ